MSIVVPVFIANSVHPDQMPHSVASNLDLHCLPNTLLKSQGPVVQSIVSLTSSLVVKMLTVLVSTIQILRYFC